LHDVGVAPLATPLACIDDILESDVARVWLISRGIVWLISIAVGICVWLISIALGSCAWLISIAGGLCVWLISIAIGIWLISIAVGIRVSLISIVIGIWLSSIVDRHRLWVWLITIAICIFASRACAIILIGIIVNNDDLMLGWARDSRRPECVLP